MSATTRGRPEGLPDTPFTQFGLPGLPFVWNSFGCDSPASRERLGAGRPTRRQSVSFRNRIPRSDKPNSQTLSDLLCCGSGGRCGRVRHRPIVPPAGSVARKVLSAAGAVSPGKVKSKASLVGPRRPPNLGRYAARGRNRSPWRVLNRATPGHGPHRRTQRPRAEPFHTMRTVAGEVAPNTSAIAPDRGSLGTNSPAGFSEFAARVRRAALAPIGAAFRTQPTGAADPEVKVMGSLTISPLPATRTHVTACHAVAVIAAIRPRRPPNPAPRKSNGPAKGAVI